MSKVSHLAVTAGTIAALTASTLSAVAEKNLAAVLESEVVFLDPHSTTAGVYPTTGSSGPSRCAMD